LLAVAGLVLSAGLAFPAAAAAPRPVTVAGTGATGSSGDGGPASAARLDQPSGIAVDASGDLFVADTDNCAVREVPASAGTHYGVAMRAHRIYTVAGVGCTEAKGSVGFPTGVAVDASGDLFIADMTGDRVYELPAAGGGRALSASARAARLVAVAGTGHPGYSGNGGPAASATLDDPTAVAVDAAGDLFIADTSNCVVREVPASATTAYGQAMEARHIYTVAGTGTCGVTGLGGPAATAQLWDPTAVAVDGAGDLLIGDRGYGGVAELAVAAGTYYSTPIGAGDVAIVVGLGIFAPYLTDGLSATGFAAEANFPYGLAVAADGDLFIADTGERVIRVVPQTGGTVFGHAVSAGDLYTVLGAIPTGSNGDATKWVTAQVTTPYGVAVDSSGDLFYSDQGADVVRELSP
jgi:hypothetical protein